MHGTLTYTTSVGTELSSINRWAENNILILNNNKSIEIVIFNSDKTRVSAPPVAPLPGIKREDSITILGVTFQSNLSVKPHVTNIIQSSAQSLYALKLLKSHGMQFKTLQLICQATVLSRITYASPSWWGFTTADDKQNLQAILNRAVKWGFLDTSHSSLEQICTKREEDLFAKILSKPHHVLYHLLPPEKTTSYSLRPGPHNRLLTKKGGTMQSKNFVQRLIFRNVY